MLKAQLYLSYTKGIDMKVIINTDNTTSATRNHFGVSGEVVANVNKYRSGEISKIIINGLPTPKGSPYFNQLRVLVMDADHA